jgi:hypothetical protein
MDVCMFIYIYIYIYIYIFKRRRKIAGAREGEAPE